MKNEVEPPRRGITIDGELASALDNALQYERSQGKKWLKNRSQIASIWLWQQHKEWMKTLKKEDTKIATAT